MATQTILALVALFCLTFVFPSQSAIPKTCRGTNYGVVTQLHGSTPSQRLDRLRARFSDCELVNGNLELVGLDTSQLDFLSRVRLITGYFLVYRTQLDNVSLPNLRLIRGESLFRDPSDANRSAAFAVLDNPLLGVLELGKLVEVSRGAALIRNNSRLCYVNTIRWDDILEDGNGTSVGLSSSGAGCLACPGCSDGRCWSPSVCQQPLSKVVCSLLGCTSRCLVGTCCNSACAAGCFLPVSDQGCNECKYLEDGNSCRGQGGSCTADHELLGLRLCVSPADCPENFLQESDPPRYCGPNCVANLAQTSSIYNELTGQCQSCTGLSCAKKCPGMEQIGPVIHKGNIAAFTDCNIVQGSIHIDQVSFTGDNSAGIEPLTFSDLHTLANVTEINGYLAITGVQDPSFTDLSFLASLRAIRGRYTLYASNWSLYIENNQHLTSLKTNSLERIDRGDVRINSNNQLCFVDSINWTSVLQLPGNFLAVIENPSTCSSQGNVCDVECNGCWGLGPEQCQLCNNFTYDNFTHDELTGIRVCVPECNLDTDGKTCLPCPKVCKQFCKGPSGTDCVSDGPPGSECKYLIQEGVCVEDCTDGFYKTANRTCAACNSACSLVGSLGCDGPGSFQGTGGGCEECKTIKDPNMPVFECLALNEVCPKGTFQGTAEVTVSGSKQTQSACVSCTPGCVECTKLGLKIPEECQECAAFKQAGTCVSQCSVAEYYPSADKTDCLECHSECNQNCSLADRQCGCSGPKDTDCKGCANERERVFVTVSPGPSTAPATNNVSTTAPANASNSSPTVNSTTTCNGTGCNQTSVNETTTIRPPTRRPTPRPTRPRFQLTRCISACPSDKQLVDHQRFCVNVCPPGYYNDGTIFCKQCDRNCNPSASCTGNTAFDCDQCLVDTLIHLDNTTECVEKCETDLFNIQFLINSTNFCEILNVTQPTNATSIAPPPEKKASTVGIAIGGSIGGVLIVALILILIYVAYSRAHAPVKLQSLLLELEDLPEEYRSGEAKLEVIEPEALEMGNKLGSGTFGIVYKGYWHPEGKNLKVPVGIKVLDEALELKDHKDILQEVVLLSAVSSPDVLRVLGISLGENGVMLVSLYCPFGALLNFLRRQKRYLTSTALLTYSWQIAKGMEFLEVKGIVHGNLACRNVLVQKPNQARISDYGTASLAENTRSRMLLPWMAPESIQNNTFTNQSDVWSYGVTLWEIMTFGGTPYSNKEGDDILSVLQTGERLRQPKMVTVEVYGLMLRSWLFDESARVSFSELTVDLEGLKRDPSRYVIVSRADEADKDDRAERMRRYADTLGTDQPAEGQYELDYDPEAEKALYEDPDAAGFLHYEDPEKLQNGDAVASENPYDNEEAEKNDYENPLPSPTKPVAESVFGGSINRKDSGRFDEPGYDSVSSSQGPSRVGSSSSQQPEGPKYNVPPAMEGLVEADESGYEDPTNVNSMAQKPEEEVGSDDPLLGSPGSDGMGEDGYQDPTNMQQGDDEDYENPLVSGNDNGYQEIGQQ